MRRFLFAIFCAVLLAGCTTQPSGDEVNARNEDIRAEDLTRVEKAGRQAATDAIKYPAGSRERDAAILEIRSAEERLREAGMETMADVYRRGAQSVLANE